MKINSNTINLFTISKEVSERNGLKYSPETIALGTLATMADSPLHSYLIKQGMEHKDIVQKSYEFFLKHDKEEKERTKKYNEFMKNVKKEDKVQDGSTLTKFVLEKNEEIEEVFVEFPIILNGDNTVLDFLITAELFDVYEKAEKIADEMYNDTEITNAYMLAAFSEALPDMYLDFIIFFLGKDAVLPKTVADAPYVESTEEFLLPRKLANFLTVLNNKYSPDDEFCKILGRDEETAALTKILAKATKRNAILVGYPGVGKTAIVEKFVYDIVKGNCFSRFKDAKVLALDVTSIVAGTKYRGMAEERFQELVKFLENNSNCILFIDEIHTILGAGACKDGEMDLANALKPILARGDTQVIGATTFDEYEKYFSKDGALKRRFEKIIVNEPKSEDLYDMIKNQIFNLEVFHRVKISREMVDFAILNAACFNYETKNPDRTLDLIDRSMAGAEINGKSVVEKEDILANFAIRKKQFEKMSDTQKRAVAYHEAGHYIVQHFSPELKSYHTLAISIIPAEDYLGVNVFEQDEDETPSANREYYIQMIAKLLGGRRAEKIYTKELSAGANSDLAKATKIAKDMVTRYGLDEQFSENRVYLRECDNPMYTERLIEKISLEIDKILDNAKLYADQILRSHNSELERLVDNLVEKGMLSKVELEKIFENSNS